MDTSPKPSTAVNYVGSLGTPLRSHGEAPLRCGASQASTPAGNSGVIEMRALAAQKQSEARTSMPTLDFVLGVSTPVAPLGHPLAVEIPRARPQRTSPVVAGAAFLLIAGVLAGLARETREAHVAATPDKAAPVHVEASFQAAREVESALPSPTDATDTTTANEPIVRARPRRPARAPSSEPSSPAHEETLEELLHRASGTATPASTPEVASSAPRTPSRDDVRGALTHLSERVSACAPGTHGLAPVTVTFDGDTGRVRSAVVSGDFAGTPAGSCIARVVRDAEVAPFAQPSFTVQYPYAI